MTLIACPECNKQNVSDSAHVCPECGYSIKNYIEEQNKKREDERIFNEIQPPRYPSLGTMVGCGLMGIFMLAITILMFKADGLSIFSIGSSIITFLFSIDSIGEILYIKEYNRAFEDYERYKREEFNRIQEEKKRLEEIEKAKPKCPACGSHDTFRISTVSRAASVAMVGVASGKIGKNLQCKKCGNRW